MRLTQTSVLLRALQLRATCAVHPPTGIDLRLLL
jgi:hypothetical protein